MHLRNLLFLLGSLFFFFTNGQSQELLKKGYTTAQAKNEIVIDGKLDDSSWDEVEWGGDFVGHRPEYNVAPSQETQFKILYDEKFLYVGIRAFDTEPEKIVKRMSRRDGFDGDWLSINIDSYNDKRTAFSFTASVSGVKSDEYITNNENFDSTWDPIWYLKTSVDEQGWIAEFKIPLSQLRFANKEDHTWGLQLTRRLFRKQERSTWQPADPNAAGWVHLFGELNGIKGIKSQKQLEIQPYRVESFTTFPKEEGNPFRFNGSKYETNMGLDAKIGLTSDITLDLTINPDFGQVEADPSQVNLSAFRLFFREQRPFFLEGSNILSFRTSGGPNNLFYSRRIGARPHGNLYAHEDIAYSDSPAQTRILGAAKITGKNAKGFSWGILESVTNREKADVIDTLGNSRKEIIEPYTNYLVARAQQDLNEGQTVFGGIVTHMKRFDNDVNGLDMFHDEAVSAGVDLDHNLWDRKYGFNAKYMFSRVSGDVAAIHDTQLASERNFQRTDNNHKSVDSTLTTLAGSAASLTFGKRSGNFQWTAGTNFKSPELALNDAGFLRQTDDVNLWLFSRYRINEPRGILRSQNYNSYMEQNYDFGGIRTNVGGNIGMNWEFTNLWEFGQSLFIGGKQVSNADLRGGPSITYPGGKNYRYYFGSNRQKKVSFNFRNWFFRGDEGYAENWGANFNITIRPVDALRITLSPNFNSRRNDLQYVDNSYDSASQSIKYVLGTVNQKTFRMSIRINYNITPNLTLEFWGQPFIAEGKYSQFKTVEESNSENYDARFRSIEGEYSYDEDDGLYSVNSSQDSSPDYQFIDRNFSSVSFQSNMVMRWEYIPGSTLFLVWANSGSADVGEYGEFGDLGKNLLDIEGNNAFVIKYTYRFIL